MNAKFLALVIALGMVSVSPALGDSVLLDGSSESVDLGPFIKDELRSTFTLTVGFDFMPGSISEDDFGYLVGEIPVEAEMEVHWDPAKLDLIIFPNLLTYMPGTGVGTFDLYAPGGPGASIMDTVTLEFIPLMPTDPTTPIHLWGTGFYELVSAPSRAELESILAGGLYEDYELVSHTPVHNTAYVTIVPEPATLSPWHWTVRWSSFQEAI